MTNVRSTHYILGSALGSHPYPMMVRDFHRVIGDEARRQILEREEHLPDVLVACVGGGSNAIGLFYPFLEDTGVRCIGVEAGGHGILAGQHAARFQGGALGVLQGARTFILQDQFGQIQTRIRSRRVSTMRPSGRSIRICAIKSAWSTTSPPTTRH